GSQYVGMAKDLFESSPEVKELYKKAGEVLEYDLAKVCFEGPDDLLVQTKYTQPAIFVHSLSLYHFLEKDGIKPSFVAGHSLGEYSAAVSAGIFLFEDGLFAVKNRSSLMQKACDKEKGTMAAIIGLSRDKILEICKQASGYGIVQPANFNSSDQVAITGDLKGVEKGAELAKKAGAKRVMMLAVGGAYHSPLMNSAKDGMVEILNKVEINQGKVPLIANVNAKPVDEPMEIKNLLVEQITSPVLWHQSMEYLYEQGIRDFVEIGPGKVLQGLLKRSFKEINLYGIDKLSELEKFIEDYKTVKV
ncbi:MAG: ACP S-malonyltransferase, partial [candidate division Zixibacteria bacterium]|nr:ACP S-malonyltransferase [candidate division Zixibacteria bacterium]